MSETSVRPRKGAHKSIGFKLIALIAISLAITVTALVLNATRLFRKDNLNNIYVSSDLLTAAKASEVRYWLDSLARKGELLGQSLVSSGGAAGNASNEWLEQFRKDRELVFAVTYMPGAGGAWDVKKAWLNPVLSHELGFTDERFLAYRETLKAPFAKILAGEREVKSAVLPTGQAILVFSLPLRSAPGRPPSGIVLGVRPDELFDRHRLAAVVDGVQRKHPGLGVRHRAKTREHLRLEGVGPLDDHSIADLDVAVPPDLHRERQGRASDENRGGAIQNHAARRVAEPPGRHPPSAVDLHHRAAVEREIAARGSDPDAFPEDGHLPLAGAEVELLETGDGRFA